MNLLPFQEIAATQILAKISAFERKGRTHDGYAYPCLVFLSAITGAGKTPILTYTASKLDNSIIFWTTPPASVVSQTVEKLKGQYADVLGRKVEIFAYEDMTDDDWRSVIDGENGTSLIVCTVASYNRQEKTLNIYKKGMWDKLKDQENGGERKRHLFVIYDEAHNLTDQQAELLLELSPYAIIGASGSSIRWDGLPRLSPHLVYATKPERDRILREATVKIETPHVVAAGLLKKRLVLSDCRQDRLSVLASAVSLRDAVESKLSEIYSPPPYHPVACHIVSRTDAGVELWDMLRGLGVHVSDIAVHLINAQQVADAYAQDKGMDVTGFNDTYTQGASPSDLHQRGYKHIIWNKALKEGWDEPWAFVGYFDATQHSESDIRQKIGRFLRNPFRDEKGYPTQPSDVELYTATFFLNKEDGFFEKLFDNIKADLELSYPGIVVSKNSKWTEISSVRPEINFCVPTFSLKFDGDGIFRDIESELSSIPFDEQSRTNDGYVRSIAYDVETKLHVGSTTDLGRVVHYSVSDATRSIISGLYPQLLRSGTIDEIFDLPIMKAKIAIGSVAHKALQSRLEVALGRVKGRTDLVSKPKSRWWSPCDVSLTFGDEDDIRYKPFESDNTFHVRGYNSLSVDERDVASALSMLNDCRWMRNPSGSNGYAIPILSPDTSNANFYPDFVVHYQKKWFFIDPKGDHLLTDAIDSKLLKLPNDSCSVFFLNMNKSRSIVKVYDSASAVSRQPSHVASSVLSALKWLMRVK